MQDHIHIPLKNGKGHATFTGTPTKEQLEIVNAMAERISKMSAADLKKLKVSKSKK